VRIADLHRSNPIIHTMLPTKSESSLPEGWLSQELVESPLDHKKVTDAYYSGVILLQMLMGRDVVWRYIAPHIALQSCKRPVRQILHYR
jgi:eukaryotic translation initiation factor 2-alpha kinase 4